MEKLITLSAPTFDRKYETSRLIESIQNMPDWQESANVLIVDDGSSDGTTPYLKEKFKQIDIIHLNKNGGPASARNMAIKNCHTPFIAFFDSDVVVGKNWLDIVKKHLDNKTILGGTVYKADGAVDWGPRRSTFLGGSIRTTVNKANVVFSNNMVIPVELAKKMNGFREDFGIYFEDSEFCIRARVSYNAKVKFIPELKVVHYHRSKFSPEREYLFWRNKVCAMLELYPEIHKKLLFLLFSFFLLFLYLRGLRVFFQAFKGYIYGIRKYLKMREAVIPFRGINR